MSGNVFPSYKLLKFGRRLPIIAKHLTVAYEWHSFCGCGPQNLPYVITVNSAVCGRPFDQHTWIINGRCFCFASAHFVFDCLFLFTQVSVFESSIRCRSAFWSRSARFDVERSALSLQICLQRVRDARNIAVQEMFHIICCALIMNEYFFAIEMIIIVKRDCKTLFDSAALIY